MLRTLLIAAIALLLSAPADAGAVYRWVDKDGNVHYSSKPPPEGGADRVRLEPPPPQGGTDSAADASASEPAAEAGDPTSAIQQKQCELARATLEAYESADALVDTDEQGNKRQLTAEEKAQEIEKARQNVEAQCTEKQQ